MYVVMYPVCCDLCGVALRVCMHTALGIPLSPIALGSVTMHMTGEREKNCYFMTTT